MTSISTTSDAAMRRRMKRLATLAARKEELLAAEIELVREAIESGATWGDIGRVYGISRQAARERFIRRISPPKPARRSSR